MLEFWNEIEQDYVEERNLRSNQNGAGSKVSVIRRVNDGKYFVKKVMPLRVLESLKIVKEYTDSRLCKGVPKIFYILKDGEDIVTVEEYVGGINLSELNIDTYKDYRWIFEELLSVVGSIHSFVPPIVHRDIKPENIIVDIEEKKVWLVDFSGVKTCDGPAKSRDTVLIGTPSYAAPEQYGFAESDTRTDVFGLGKTMQECLDRIPKDRIDDKDYREVMKLIDKATNISPDKRYQNANELRLAFAGKETTDRNDDKSGFVKFLPPGFRTGNPLHMIVGFVCYVMAYSFATNINTDSMSTRGGIIFKVVAFLMYISIALFYGNYLDVQDRIPLLKSDKTSRRVMMCVAVTVSIIINFCILEYLVELIFS